MSTKKSIGLYHRALEMIPGGVNSPVRAFKAIGIPPTFMERAKGSKIFDVDGNEYIDYVGSWGPMILGHAHPKIVAALKKAIPKGTSYGAPTPLEVELASKVKKAFPSRYAQIPVSSVKSMIGEAVASGGMRMVANVLSMKYGMVPPTIHFSNPDPECDLPYIVNQKMDREIRAVLHLGISPEDCFSSVFMGVE